VSDLRRRAAALRQRLPPRRQSAPPPENGRRLATIARSPDEELRVAWCEYEGRPYLSLRQWNRDQQGQWWPDSKRGITVRLRELADVADAIAEALDLASEYQRSRPPEEGKGRRGYDPATLPPATHQEQREFDEFNQGG
jgi:hypothetical protein